MNGRYLLDTNIIIALFADDQAVKDNLERVDEAFVSNIVLGELYYGARNSTKVDENIQRIEDFSSAISVIHNNQDTARQYGQIKTVLRTKGRPIPENDIWLAAQACQYHLSLVSRDQHFREIELLSLETW